MTKQAVTIHVYAMTGDYRPGDIEVFTNDFRANADCMTHRAWLCSQEIELIIPEFDLRQMEIDALEKCVQSERADSQVRVNLLLDRISKLQAIGHDE